jgi:hypothetical protein
MLADIRIDSTDIFLFAVPPGGPGYFIRGGQRHPSGKFGLPIDKSEIVLKVLMK